MLVHQLTTLSGGVPSGNGALVTMDNVQSQSLSPSSMVVLRGDLTYYRTGWAGSHEFKTGIWAAPRLWRDVTTMLVNDGYILNEERQIDANNPAAGTVSFHQRYEGPLETVTTDARDRDVGIYVQDSWKPNARLTANVGVRADFVRRFDNVYGVERMNSVNIGPRFGIAFLVTEDARNVLRASAGRVHEQVNGRDPITTFGPTSVRLRRDLYDAQGDGTFETEIVTPAATAAINQLAFDPNLHQPFVDEFALGFAKQFPGQISLDVSGVPPLFHRRLRRGRHQRHLSGRSRPAVRGLWPRRS